ncbi:MAG: DUF1080 domain-containing protein [Bacteroidota bacterium]
MPRLLLILLLLPLGLLAQNEAMQSLPLNDLSAFQTTGDNWSLAKSVQANPAKGASPAFVTTPGTGILVNDPGKDHGQNIVTKLTHGDLDLSLDFMMAPGSNSGIYLMGRYEIQLFDSWGVRQPRYSDVGGIYERWDDSQPDGQKGYEGHPPRFNAARAPGLWQHLEISFRAPRFGPDGGKIENARILFVKLNGAIIHENVELTGPTRGPMLAQEGASGPILIQGDHGPVAFRNIKYQNYSLEKAQVGPLSYAVYLGKFQGLPSIDGLSPVRQGQTDIFTQSVSNEVENFIMTLKGTLTVPRTDVYQLEMNALGFGKLVIDGEEIMPMNMWLQKGEKELTAGEHALEIHYAKDASWYANGLALFIGGTRMRRHPLHVLSSMPVDRPSNPIYARLRGPQPRILRSFIDYADESSQRRIVHAVNVGLPEGMSYTFDADRAAFVQVWRGGFLDATPMWQDRGDGSSRPNGSVLTLGDQSGIGFLVSDNSGWPEEVPADFQFDFQGYEIDDDGVPIFLYALDGQVIRDQLKSEDGKSLTRTVEVATGIGQSVYLRVGQGQEIIEQEGGRYLVDQLYQVEIAPGLAARVRQTEEQSQLLIPLEGGKSLSYRLVW